MKGADDDNGAEDHQDAGGTVGIGEATAERFPDLSDHGR